MKKKVFTTLICVLIMCMFPMFMFGCKEQTHSVDEIDSLYTSMKSNKETSAYFQGDNLVVAFDGTKINVNDSSDKSFIFSQAYQYYLASSSRLFSVVMSRTSSKPSFVIRNFKPEEITNIYNKLVNLNTAMKEFNRSKTIYEESNGNLYYQSFIYSYNTFLNAIYSLNEAFANAYFNSVGKVNFTKTSLDDSDIRDSLCYYLMLASKVSFSYELVSFKPSNPLGEINTWYSNTTQISSFVNLAYTTLSKIDSHNTLGTNTSRTASLFVNLKDYADRYNNEYKYFERALKKCNAKEYIASENKELYLENCSPLERSSLNIVKYFVEGRYLAVTKCLTEIVSTIH